MSRFKEDAQMFMIGFMVAALLITAILIFTGNLK